MTWLAAALLLSVTPLQSSASKPPKGTAEEVAPGSRPSEPRWQQAPEVEPASPKGEPVPPEDVPERLKPEQLRRDEVTRVVIAIAILLLLLVAVGFLVRLAWKRRVFARLFDTVLSRLILVGWAGYFLWYTWRVGWECWVGDFCDNDGSRSDLLWLLPLPFALVLALKWVARASNSAKPGGS